MRKLYFFFFLRKFHILRNLVLALGFLGLRAEAQLLPNFTGAYGTQLTNTNGQWVTINPAQPGNIDLLETRIFKMPQKGTGVLGIEFKVVGADGGTARYLWGANDKFSKGGGGGQVQFTLDLGKTSWLFSTTGPSTMYGQPFLVTFGKKGESKQISKGFYVSAGGGGSTGMSWLIPETPLYELNRYHLIAAAGGGSGGYSFVFGTLNGNSAIRNARAESSVFKDYNMALASYGQYNDDVNTADMWIVSGGSDLATGDNIPAYCCSTEDKKHYPRSLAHYKFDYVVGYDKGLQSVTHGQGGGQPVVIFEATSGTPNLTGFGPPKAYEVIQLGGKGGAGFGGGGAGSSTTTATDSFTKANGLPTGGAGGTGSKDHSALAHFYPSNAASGYNNYSDDAYNVSISSRTQTDNPQSGYIMYRTIQDTEKPKIYISSMTVYLRNGNAPLGYIPAVPLAEAMQPYIMKINGLWDNDAIATITATVSGQPITHFDCSMARQDVPVQLTVTDAAGNSTTALVMVKVIDPFKPVAIPETSSNPFDPDKPWRINVDDGPVTLTAANFPTAYDGCDGSNVTINFPPTTFYCNDAGDHSVAFYYTDRDGNNSQLYTKTFHVVCSNANTGGNANWRYLYVDPTARGSKDGSSWANAFTDLQDALNYPYSASVYVAKGTYYPTADDDRTATFRLRDRTRIYGGFPNGGADFAKRDPEAHPTILSGKISSTENSYHVVTITGNNTRLEGLTIRDGKADHNSSDGGSGLLLNQTVVDLGSDHNTTIRNCKFIDNYGIYGGAAYIEYKNQSNNNNLNIENCAFENNSTYYSGGAVFLKNQSSTDNMHTKFVNGVFSGNTANVGGGAVAVDSYASAEIINCTFSGNNAVNYGGALFSSGKTRLHNSILYFNTATNNPQRNEIYRNSGTIQADYCNIQGSGGSDSWVMGASGISDSGYNIDADPLFNVSPVLSISAASPCYNAGKNEYNSEPYDIYGKNYRIQGVIDIGAFEAAGNVVFVAADATTGGDGNSWATAFNNLNVGIAAAGTSANQKDVWVKAGTYRPDRLPGATAGSANDRENSFYVSNSLKIYGGFAGTENSTTQRTIWANPTILSGDIGTLNDASDNVYHVVTMVGYDTRLDGLIIEGGNANHAEGGDHSRGGGVYERVEYASTGKNRVVNCVFRHNQASGEGGAWYAAVRQNGGTDFVQTLFYDNSAFRGAASYATMAHPNANYYNQNFYNVTVSANTSSAGDGGAFEANELTGRPANITFYNSVLAGNTPQNYNNSTGHIQFQHTYLTNTGSDVFRNPSEPAGPDGMIMTADDGLQGGVYSPAINFGDETYLYENLDKDITGSVRINHTLDAGAYESAYQAPLSGDNQGIIYVRSIAFGEGTGSSWENATSDLHNAIHTPGVQKVFVAVGNYKVGDHSFIMKNGVEIYGGFDPANGIRDLSHSRIMPDPTNNSAQSSVLDGQSVRPVIWNVFSQATALNRSAVLDGFMLSNGKHTYGGGVVNYYASPLLRNVVIYANRATHFGAGVYNAFSSPALINVIINNNGIDARLNPNGGEHVMGAGMYNIVGSNPELTNVTVTENFLFSQPDTDAEMKGAGIYNHNSSPIIHNSIIWNNRHGYITNQDGIDIKNEGGATVSIQNSMTQTYTTGQETDHIITGTYPGFVDTGRKDFRLTVGSPAIDGGSNALFGGLNAESKDLAGNERVFDYAHGKSIDIGAYEYQCINMDYSTFTMEDVSVVYDGQAHGITVQDLPQGLSVTYEIADSLNNRVAGNTAVGAGMYTVFATISPLVSGVDCTPLVTAATLTIRKAEALITADSLQMYRYDGTLRNVIAALNHTESVPEYLPQQGYTNLGVYPVTVSAPETDNYLGVSQVVVLAIENAEFMGLSLQDGESVYDGTPKSLAVAGTLPDSTAVAYSGNERTEAGVYSVNAWVKNNNYQDLWLRAELAIHKAPAVITADSVQHFEYDGTVKNVVASLNHSDTTLSYSPQQGYSAVGRYPIIITAGETVNYLAAVDTVILVITNPDLDVTLSDSTFTYDGGPKSLSIKGDLPLGATVSYSGNGKTNAGVYTVEALIEVPENIDTRLSATLTIEKAPSVITADSVQRFEYDGTVKNVVASLSHSDTTLSYSPQQGYSAAGTYPIIIRAGATANYLAAVDTVSLVIESADLAGVSFKDSTVTYDGGPKSLAISGSLPLGATVSYSGNGKTNAGVYTVEALIQVPSYSDVALSATLTIEKAPSVITADSVQRFEYDGTVKDVVAILNHSDTTLSYSPQQGYSAAGTYPIIITAGETVNYLAAADTVSLVIESAELTGITLSDSTVTYDGGPKSLFIKGDLPSDGTVSYTGNGKTGAGVYTVEALIEVPGYIDTHLSATLTIEKAPSVITADSVQHFEYDGTVKNVVASLNHSDTTLSYSPQQGYSAAGTYPIIITAGATANYLAAADTVSLVIANPDLDVTLNDSTFTYDGGPKSLFIKGDLPSDGTVSYTGNGKTNAGVYTVEALIEVPGYIDTHLSATLTIEKAPSVITADSVQRFEYDGTVKNVVASLNHSDTTLSYSPQQGYSAAGTYPIIITAGATANYLAAADTVSLVIESAGLTGVSFKDSTVTYDGGPKSLAISGSLPLGATVSYSGNDKTNAGVYTVEALIQIPDYSDVALSATLTIEKAPSVITASPTQTFTYDGTVKNIVASLSHSDTTLSYSPQQGYSAAGTYPIIIRAGATANYLAAVDTVSLVIESAVLAGVSFKDSTVTYDGGAKSLAISGSLPLGATVSYSGNGKTNAGVYTVEALIEVPGYSDVALSAMLTIEKAPSVITASLTQTFTYDGAVKNVVASLNHSDTTLSYSPQQGYSAVGTYPIIITAGATANYLAADTVKVTLVIDKATFQGVSMWGAEYTYDGTVRNLYVSGAPDGATVTYTGNGQSQSGTYTVMALLQKENYHDLELSATLVIRKAQSVIWTEAMQSHVYDGTQKAVQAWLNHSETVLSYSPQQGYVDAGTYDITVMAPETHNYLATSTSVRLFIDKARFEGVSLSDAEFTYNGTPHSLQVSGAPDGATVTYTGNGQVNAGTYRVEALVQMKNYYDLELNATLIIHKAPQYISFEDIGIKHLENDSDFQLEAYSSSGLPISYTYTYDAEEAPATVSAAGWVELHTSGYVQITAHQGGNENYLPAESVTRQLKINSSDATVHRISLGGEVTEVPDTDIYYLMDCGDERTMLDVQLKTEVGASVVPGRMFSMAIPQPGIYTQEVVITSQDSTHTLTYRITVEKRFDFEDIGVQKFNNLFLINNNPETNGGYSFEAYEWYKNGELVGTGQYYSVGGGIDDVLDEQASYSVRLKTTAGQWLSVCAFSFRADASFTLSISPNPVISGHRLRLKVSEGGEARVRVLTSTGVQVLDQRIKDSTAELTLPSELSAGTYILQYENGNKRKTLQFVLQK